MKFICYLLLTTNEINLLYEKYDLQILIGLYLLALWFYYSIYFLIFQLTIYQKFTNIFCVTGRSLKNLTKHYLQEDVFCDIIKMLGLIFFLTPFLTMWNAKIDLAVLVHDTRKMAIGGQLRKGAPDKKDLQRFFPMQVFFA